MKAETSDGMLMRDEVPTGESFNAGDSDNKGSVTEKN